jgi:hypothetical protein
MRSLIRTFTLILGAISVCGCAIFTPQDNTIDQNLEAILDQFCPIPASSKSDGNHVLRARLVLAATAGYGYRNIELFSTTTDAANDSSIVIDHIQYSLASIKAAKDKQDKPLFPVYRADYIVDLAQTAAVASQPALRAGRKLIGAANLSQLDAAKSFSLAVLTDQLYADAYSRACTKVFAGTTMPDAEAEANARITARCVELAKLAKKPDTAKVCALP